MANQHTELLTKTIKAVRSMDKSNYDVKDCFIRDAVYDIVNGPLASGVCTQSVAGFYRQLDELVQYCRMGSSQFVTLPTVRRCEAFLIELQSKAQTMPKD